MGPQSRESLNFGNFEIPIWESRNKIDTHYLKLMICLIDCRKLRCLVGLTYIRSITKFELQKGMKKKPLVAQSMAHTSSW